MKIIDVHAHYDDERYADDLEKVLKDARENEVEYIINAGAGVDESKEAVNLAKKYDIIYATIGIHPENVDKVDSIDEIKEIYEQNKDCNKIIAIGEIGLDYHYTKLNKEEQKSLFKDQLEYAKEIGIPVQVHSRDAAQDTIAVIEDADAPNEIMFHCFDLNEHTARYIIEKGYKVSLGGNITYKRTENAIKVIKDMPLENIMTETDAPYLSPEGYRGKRNHSKYIVKVIEKIAEIKELPINEVANILYNNAKTFYKLK